MCELNTDSARERELAARKMLNAPDTIGIAMQQRRWDLLHAVADYVESDPLTPALAFTDPSLYQKLSREIAHFHLAGFGKLDVTELARLAEQMRQPPSSDTIGKVARTVREIRCAKGITQEALAEKSGVALGTLRVFERTGKISLERLVRLLDALESRAMLEPLVFGPTPTEKAAREPRKVGIC